MDSNPAPPRAKTVIDEMLDRCAKLEAGQEVLIFAHLDGLRDGSENMVEPRVVDWIHSAVKARGANSSVLWIDEPQDTVNEWPVPRVLKQAIGAADVVISHSFHFNVEDLFEFREWGNRNEVVQVRNFATTARMMTSDWAYTPFELVAEIRYCTAELFQVGLPWTLEHENGTYLEGAVGWGGPPAAKSRSYARYRTDDFYRPFPDWVIPPILHDGVTGVMVVDRGYPWWTRWIGISPEFEAPMRIEVRDGMIEKISGGREADLTVEFIREHLEPHVGDKAWMFTRMHPGIHPNGRLSPEECPNILHRRLIDQGNSSVVHMHIGHGILPEEVEGYRYGLHITGDIENATWTVGGRVVMDKGRNVLFDDPEIMALAGKYPDRPGLGNGKG